MGFLTRMIMKQSDFLKCEVFQQMSIAGLLSLNGLKS